VDIIYERVSLPHLLKVTNQAAVPNLIRAGILFADLIGVKICYRQLSGGKVLAPLIHEVFIKLSIHMVQILSGQIDYISNRIDTFISLRRIAQISR
jgi:hypothetical protein